MSTDVENEYVVGADAGRNVDYQASKEQSTSSSNSSEEISDLDDPRLQEPQNYDPNADSQQFIPPPEIDENGNAIDYQIKLSLGENKKGNKRMYFKTDKNGRPFGILMVEARIVDPTGMFDNFKLASVYPTTMTNRTSASEVSNLARVCGSPLPAGLTLKEIAEAIEPLLAAEPVVLARIQWTAYCRACDQEKGKLAGERNWPVKLDDQGNQICHTALKDCPDCGADLTPNIKIKRYIT